MTDEHMASFLRGLARAERFRREHMPTYLYRCPAGDTKEISHSIHHEPVIICDKCGAEMNRQPQRADIKFYGSGFYTTDKNK